VEPSSPRREPFPDAGWRIAGDKKTKKNTRPSHRFPSHFRLCRKPSFFQSRRPCRCLCPDPVDLAIRPAQSGRCHFRSTPITCRLIDELCQVAPTLEFGPSHIPSPDAGATAARRCPVDCVVVVHAIDTAAWPLLVAWLLLFPCWLFLCLLNDELGPHVLAAAVRKMDCVINLDLVFISPLLIFFSSSSMIRRQNACFRTLVEPGWLQIWLGNWFPSIGILPAPAPSLEGHFLFCKLFFLILCIVAMAGGAASCITTTVAAPRATSAGVPARSVIERKNRVGVGSDS